MTMPTTSTESKTDSTTTETSEPTVVTPADLGYDEPAAAPAAAPAAPATTTPEAKKPDDKSATPVTGYIKPAEPAAAPAAPEAKPDDKPAEPTEEEKTRKEISDVVSTLGDGYSKEKITKFALDNKLSKAQVEAYVSQLKADDAAEAKAREEAVTEKRKTWNEELVKDPDFGGENFDKSVHEVEQLVEKYFPNTKKMLTEKKGMLPPYFMKDLLTVAKALKPTNKFEGGEPPAPAEETDNFLDDMYT